MTESLPAKASEKKPTFKFGILRKYEPDAKPIAEESPPKTPAGDDRRGEEVPKGSKDQKPPPVKKVPSTESEAPSGSQKSSRALPVREEVKQPDDSKPFHLPPLALPRTKLETGPKNAQGPKVQEILEYRYENGLFLLSGHHGQVPNPTCQRTEGGIIDFKF